MVRSRTKSALDASASLFATVNQQSTPQYTAAKSPSPLPLSYPAPRPSPTPPSHSRREVPLQSNNRNSGNSGNSNSGNYDADRVGHTRRDSLGIMKLTTTATDREIKITYIRLARRYRTDKYILASNNVSTEITFIEIQQHFQLISNAYEYFRTK